MARGADRWLRAGAGTAAAATTVAAASVLVFLVVSVWPTLCSGDLAAVLTAPWAPFGSPPSFGIGAMVVGSVALAVPAVLLALPVAVGVCVFARGVGPRALGRVAIVLVHGMAGVPTVVYGFVSVLLLVPVIRTVFLGGPGFSLLAAVLTLSVVILPTMVVVLDGRLAAIDPGVPVACAALGLTPAQSHARVLLPLAARGLVASALLGLCRAMGDTLVALMVAGNAARLPGSPLGSIRTLAAHIALVLATDSHGPAYRSVAAGGLVLFLLTSVLAVAVRHALGVRASVLSHADRG